MDKDFDFIVERHSEAKNRRRGPVKEILAVIDTDNDGNQCILQIVTCENGCTKHLIANEQEAFEIFKDLYYKLKATTQRNVSLRRFKLVE